MSDEQYFKPKFNDFYEGAVYYSKARDGQYVISKFTILWCFQDVLIKSPSGFDIRGNVYMKYLDGEQIEAFGFQRINMPPWGYSMTMNAPDIEWFCKGQWFVSFSPKYRNMGIFQYDAVNQGQYLSFSGEVRDFNRFVLLVDWIIVSYENRALAEATQNLQLRKDRGEIGY